ncbi:hypothetical protein Mapa_014205 [Marchantia paleacea]|nr:hypothetical protein Mapa_014205 [Marchantia paleacea]
MCVTKCTMARGRERKREKGREESACTRPSSSRLVSSRQAPSLSLPSLCHSSTGARRTAEHGQVGQGSRVCPAPWYEHEPLLAI